MLDTPHMLMTVPNLVFLVMRSPLIFFSFCLSYQLLIEFSTHTGGDSQARRQGRKGECRRSREGGKGIRSAKGTGEGIYKRSRVGSRMLEEDDMHL
jgi:hypothetical protein